MAAASALDVVALGSACTGAGSWPSACEGASMEVYMNTGIGPAVVSAQRGQTGRLASHLGKQGCRRVSHTLSGCKGRVPRCRYQAGQEQHPARGWLNHAEESQHICLRAPVASRLSLEGLESTAQARNRDKLST